MPIIDGEMADTLTKVGGGAGGLTFLAVLLRFTLMRWSSRIRLLGVRDAAEVDIIGNLQAENKRLGEALDVAYHERNEAIGREALAISRVGGLEQEVKGLSQHVARLERQVADLIQRWPGSSVQP